MGRKGERGKRREDRMRRVWVKGRKSIKGLEKS